jgi:hypothetical protein
LFVKEKDKKDVLFWCWKLYKQPIYLEVVEMDKIIRFLGNKIDHEKDEIDHVKNLLRYGRSSYISTCLLVYRKLSKEHNDFCLLEGPVKSRGKKEKLKNMSMRKCLIVFLVSQG